MNVLADALKRAGTSEGAKLRDALAQTANFAGVTGNLTINAERNAVKPAVIYKLQDGKSYPVYREEAQPSGTPMTAATAPGFVIRFALW
jgi:branched-chain amino acid transport system substrate-binding protein